MSTKYIIVPFKSKKLQGISFAIDEQDYETYVQSMPSWFLSGAKNNYATALVVAARFDSTGSFSWEPMMIR